MPLVIYTQNPAIKNKRNLSHGKNCEYIQLIDKNFRQPTSRNGLRAASPCWILSH